MAEPTLARIAEEAAEPWLPDADKLEWAATVLRDTGLLDLLSALAHLDNPGNNGRPVYREDCCNWCASDRFDHEPDCPYVSVTKLTQQAEASL